jgi:CubicO group peptidase (beta-lactamase class C family)
MKKLFLFCLVLFVFGYKSNAQKTENNFVLREGVPETQKVSAERLKRIDKLFQEYVDKGWCAGAAAIVARNGKIIYYNAVGYDDIEKKTPLKKDVIFRIASQTKAVTSVAVMMLFEEGKFLLDDPVSKYIPEFKNVAVVDKFNEKDTTFTTVKAKRQITIRDLLTHTSGIGYPQIGSAMMNAIYSKYGIISGIGENNYILKDQMKKLASLPLFHQPGEKFTYGLNIDLLGHLIEVVSGMSLDQFMSENIFKPLGMNDTYFYLPKEKQNRLATVYTEDSLKHTVHARERSGTLRKFDPNYPKLSGTYYSGGAGLSSTAYDYAIFMQMILNGGIYNGKRILGRNTVRMMETNQIGDLIVRGYNKFGLGFEITSETGSSKLPLPEGVCSWGGIFSSSYWIDPKEKIIAQLVLQKYPNSYGDISNKFITLVYSALND